MPPTIACAANDIPTHTDAFVTTSGEDRPSLRYSLSPSSAVRVRLEAIAIDVAGERSKTWEYTFTAARYGDGLAEIIDGDLLVSAGSSPKAWALMLLRTGHSVVATVRGDSAEVQWALRWSGFELLPVHVSVPVSEDTSDTDADAD